MKVYDLRGFGTKAESRSISEGIAEAAEAVRRGELVIFPTETVYGLACDALNDLAVKSLIEAKGRRSGHPLPVQIVDAAGLDAVASQVPQAARLLAEKFWPGPLTLVVPKNERISDMVSGGLASVGIRVPDHPVALALLRELGSPIVATSANLTGNDAPADSETAISEVGLSVSVVLDSGPCRLGRASTVVDTTVVPPRILRLGSISRGEIAAVIGEVSGE
jgi:L-threonylcarbamoyladenylate synthase